MMKTLYFDMDNVLVDFPSALKKVDAELLAKHNNNLDEIPGLFGVMDPVPGALEAFEELSVLFDSYILSTAPWKNPSAWADKLLWVQKYMGQRAYKRLILSHHKHLNRGDFLIDDRKRNGADRFEGEHIHFGTEAFPDWPSVLTYLKARA